MSTRSVVATRRALRLAGLAAALMLAACGSSEPAPQAPPADEALERVSGAARAAFEQGRYAQAVELYSETLDLAYARDDVNAIIDAQFNAALSNVELGRYVKALDGVRQARSELIREGLVVPADLLLLEATVLYRQGQPAGAFRITEQMFSGGTPVSGATASRAHFLRGIIAAEQGDVRTLREALGALGESTDARLEADRVELTARTSVLEGRPREAVAGFERAARLRGDTLDYRGTVRALSLAGEAAEQAGDLELASGLYLRAGRSAASQGVIPDAKTWLERAASLADRANDPDTANAARAHLARLEELAEDDAVKEQNRT